VPDETPRRPNADPRRVELAVLLGLAVLLLLAVLAREAMDRRARRAVDVVRAAAEAQEVIDLNRASAAELELLPGVGPDKAARIIEWRSRRGPFQRPEDLAGVPGFSAEAVDRLLPLVSCSAP
jgi:competence protein ComEA